MDTSKANLNTQGDKKGKQDKSKKNRTILIILGILIIAVIMILLLRSCSVDDPENPDIGLDPNATDEDIGERSKEDIINDLNKKVEDGMINISMNLNPTFENGTAKGNLLIVNSERNKYPQYVTIVRDDTGETIYKSGGIKVGNRIDQAALNVNLPAGTYDCTATFTQYEEETSAILGSAAARLTITVLN